MGGGRSKSGGTEASFTRTEFPTEFLSSLQKVYGPGFGVNELIASLPRTQGLFGGQAGLFPTAQAPAPPNYQTQQNYVAPQAQGYQLPPNQAPGVPVTPGVPTAPTGFLGWAAPPVGRPGTGDYPGQAPVLDPATLAQQTQRFTSPAPEVGLNNQLAGGIQGTLARAGFNAPPAEFATPTINTLPGINAAQVNMQDLPAYQRQVFESQFRPVERELSRANALNQQTLASQLTQRGMGASGSGLGIQQKAERETGKQIQFAAEDAANRSSVQRFQMEFQQKLTNAGFDMQAQMTNADNILRGDMAKADTYLKTMGLNQEVATKHRDDVLRLLGVQQADLARMDQFNLAVTDRLLNTWLQTASVISEAGRVADSTKVTGSEESHGGVLSG